MKDTVDTRLAPRRPRASAGGTVLVVDDDEKLRKLLSLHLRRQGFAVHTAEGVEAARSMLGSLAVDAIVSDLRLGDGTGLDLLAHTQRERPGMPLILMTAFGTVELAVKAMSEGAFHFLVKPFLMDQLGDLCRKAIELTAVRRENRALRERVAELPGTELVGESERMRNVRELVRRVATTQTNVLLTGQSGTGKEIAARLIHEQSPRSGAPFVRVNCAALPRDLLEAELFGHRKGAFTGATGERPGRFRAAHRGTLFLDEISTLPYDVQAKLLRALQFGEVSPLGSDEVVRVDVRLVAATNQDLAEESRRGAFREDLYYRLSVFPIQMPPLSQRLEDLPLLVPHLLERLCVRMGRRIPTVDDSQLQRLARYRWPGNVRELENLLERALILDSGNTLRADHLIPPDVADVAPGITTTNLAQAVGQLERSMVSEALQRMRGKKKDAARELGLSPRALSYYLRKHSIRG